METWLIIALIVGLLLIFGLGVVSSVNVVHSNKRSGYSFGNSNSDDFDFSCGEKKNSCSIGGGSRGKLVLFYTTWCGYCKELKPVWAKLQKTYPDMVVGIDADNADKLRQAFSVTGYPSIYWCPNGLNEPSSAENYDGDRDYKSLAKFLKSKA